MITLYLGPWSSHRCNMGLPGPLWSAIPGLTITSSTSLTLNVWYILCDSGTPQVQNRPVLSPIGLVLYSLHGSPEALSTCNEEDQWVDRPKEPGLPQGSNRWSVRLHAWKSLCMGMCPCCAEAEWQA